MNNADLKSYFWHTGYTSPDMYMKPAKRVGDAAHLLLLLSGKWQFIEKGGMVISYPHSKYSTEFQKWDYHGKLEC